MSVRLVNTRTRAIAPFPLCVLSFSSLRQFSLKRGPSRAINIRLLASALKSLPKTLDDLQLTFQNANHAFLLNPPRPGGGTVQPQDIDETTIWSIKEHFPRLLSLRLEEDGEDDVLLWTSQDLLELPETLTRLSVPLIRHLKNDPFGKLPRGLLEFSANAPESIAILDVQLLRTLPPNLTFLGIPLTALPIEEIIEFLPKTITDLRPFGLTSAVNTGWKLLHNFHQARAAKLYGLDEDRISAGTSDFDWVGALKSQVPHLTQLDIQELEMAPSDFPRLPSSLTSFTTNRWPKHTFYPSDNASPSSSTSPENPPKEISSLKNVCINIQELSVSDLASPEEITDCLQSLPSSVVSLDITVMVFSMVSFASALPRTLTSFSLSLTDSSLGEPYLQQEVPEGLPPGLKSMIFSNCGFKPSDGVQHLPQGLTTLIMTSKSIWDSKHLTLLPRSLETLELKESIFDSSHAPTNLPRALKRLSVSLFLYTYSSERAILESSSTLRPGFKEIPFCSASLRDALPNLTDLQLSGKLDYAFVYNVDAFTGLPKQLLKLDVPYMDPTAFVLLPPKLTDLTIRTPLSVDEAPHITSECFYDLPSSMKRLNMTIFGLKIEDPSKMPPNLAYFADALSNPEKNSNSSMGLDLAISEACSDPQDTSGAGKNPRRSL